MPYLVVVLLFVGCTNNGDVKVNEDPSADNLFYDYQVMAEEGSDSATVLLQFRPGSTGGDAVGLADGRVELDGKLLALDSARNGARFYEAVLPLSGLAGKHTIAVTSPGGKTHSQPFNFVPFALAGDLAEAIPKQPFAIGLTGLPPGALLRVVLTDTSFASPDVNEELRMADDTLRFTQAMLNAVVAGPVVLHLQAETERPIQGNNKRGGRLLMTYSLKREFELVE